VPFSLGGRPIWGYFACDKDQASLPILVRVRERETIVFAPACKEEVIDYD